MPAYFGLDIGSSAIKAVQISGSKGKYQVEGIGLGVNPVGNMLTEAPTEMGVMAEAVRKVVSEAGIKLKRAWAALPEAQVYTRVIELPPLSEAELANALSWEAEQYVPVPLTEVNLDWEIIRRPEKAGTVEKMEVLLVAAPKLAVDRIVGLLQSAGLEPVGVETEILAMTKAAVSGGGIESGVPTLLCHMGASGTNLAIVEFGKLIFAYHLATGGVALTRAISQALGLEFVQAEEYKRTYGMDESQLEGKIKQALVSTLGAVVVELRKAMSFYATRNPNLRIKRVLVSGGGAQLPGLGGYLTGELNIEVVVANPLAGMGWRSGITTKFEGLESVFAVATGLAMEGE